MKKVIRIIIGTAPILMLILFFCAFSYTQKAKETITEKEAQVILEKYLKIWNDGDLALIEEIIDPEYVVHHCVFPEDIVGLDGFKNWVTSGLTAFPDHLLTFDEIIIKDDKIITRWTAAGTHKGPMSDLLPTPTGKKFRVSGLAITRIANGKVAEEWLTYNALDLFQQLGFSLMPPPQKEE